MKKASPKTPVKSSTQNFTEIELVKDDIVVFSDNSCCLIIESGAVNFMLLSEEEQQAMIYSFAALLNSLSFPVQMSILSRKMDISSYIDYVDEKIKNQPDPVLSKRLVEYREFIRNIVTRNTILEKSFYFVLPFSPLEMGIKGGTSKGISKEYVLSRARAALYPKRDHLMRLLSKTGLGGKSLFEQEVVELFYNIYNPSVTGKKLAPIKNYTDIILTT